MSTRLATAPLNVFMLEGLLVPFFWITCFQNMARWTNCLQNRFWGRVVDRFGNRPVLLMNCCILTASSLLWLAATRSNWMFILPIVHVFQGLANSGIGLSQQNLVLRIAPDQGASAFLATFNTANAVAFVIAPALGGLVAQRLEGVHVLVGPLALQGVHFLFLANVALRFGAILALRRVHEPDACGARETARRLGRVRVLCRRAPERAWPRPVRHAARGAASLYARLPHSVHVAVRRCEPLVRANPLIWAFKGVRRVERWRSESRRVAAVVPTASPRRRKRMKRKS